MIVLLLLITVFAWVEIDLAINFPILRPRGYRVTYVSRSER